MAAMEQWEKVESKKRPGSFYYFNKKTGESSWKPPRVQVSKASAISKEPNSPTGGTNTRSKPSPPSQTQQPEQRKAKSKPANLTILPHGSVQERMSLRQLMRSCSDTDSLGASKRPSRRLQASSYLHKPPTTPAELLPPTPTAMEASLYPQAMTATQRWEAVEEMEWELGIEEVEMDVDLTEEQQVFVIAEVQKARVELKPGMTPEDLGLSQDPGSYSENLYLVLDTNVLLSHLEFLAKLKDSSIRGIGRTVLIIPWVVMQELDHLKESGRVGKKARQAITFLHGAFKAKHPQVKGQTMAEAQTEVHNLAISNNDDRILHCCLVYQVKVHALGGMVVLFSNDVQLCSKAMVNSVKAVDRKTLPTELLKLSKQRLGVKALTPTATTPLTPAFQGEGMRMTSGHHGISLEESAHAGQLISEAEVLLKTGLEVAIRREMVEAFDNLWETVVVKKPPWELKDLVFLLERHWVAVFRLVLPNRVRYGALAGLQSYVKGKTALPSYSHARHLVQDGLEVLREFRTYSHPSPALSRSITQLSSLLESVKSAKVNRVSPSATEQSHTFPTPPSTPSHETPLPSNPSNLDTMREALQLSLASLPSETNCIQQVEWLLDIIYQALDYCYTQAISQVSASPGERFQVAEGFLLPLSEMLTAIISAIHSWISTGPTISVVRETVSVSNEFFDKVMRIKCPVTMETLFTVCNSPEVSQLLQHALSRYMSSLVQLNEVIAQFKKDAN